MHCYLNNYSAAEVNQACSLVGRSRPSSLGKRRTRPVLASSHALQANGFAKHEAFVVPEQRHEVLDSVSSMTAQETSGMVAAYMNQKQEMEQLKQRKPLPAVVMGMGSPPEKIAAVMLDLAQKQRSVLAIRIEPETYAAVRKHAPGVKYNMRSKTLTYSADNSHSLPKAERLAGTVALVSAGQCSPQVVEELCAVAEALGCYLFRVADGNTSALQSVFQNMQAIGAADVVVVVTGPDMSLPSVVAELVEAPVIAVPTSLMQVSSLGGIVPMLSALTASTPGVSVVSIDNGYAAAVMAARILASATRLHKLRSAAEAAAARAADMQPPVYCL